MTDTIPLINSNRRKTSDIKELISNDLKHCWNSSPITPLIIFVPIGIISAHIGLSATWVFTLNFIGIIPLAAILAFATEELSEHVGQTLGGLLNATFGNAVEIIVSIIALTQNQITVVQASMLGSILSNLLLVLGCCFAIGGIKYPIQKFNQTVAQTMSSLLALSVIGLLLPAAFHSTIPYKKVEDLNILILKFSRYCAILLLIVYCLYLIFQLKTHKYLFEDLDEASEEVSHNRSNSFISDINDSKHLGTISAIIILFISTLFVSLCADYLVSSIDELVLKSGLSKTFIGLIVIPIVGNAAEHVTAVVVAYKDKMDLAIGVAVGSSIQISLFVTPFLVIVGWIFNYPMSLYFSTYETVVMFSAVLITNYLILDGESNWLEGAMLIITYLIIAISFFFYPDNIIELVN